MNAQAAILQRDITPVDSDYETVRRVIEKISLDYRDQPSLEVLAEDVGETPTGLQKLFTRWAGLSPKAFLQAVTLDHARKLLDQGMPLLETSLEVGMSGPSRLHDLFVTHEAMSPGDYKTRGEGLTIRYGFHISPFGVALIMVTDRGLAGLAFNDAGDERAAFADMSARWPNANLRRGHVGDGALRGARLRSLAMARRPAAARRHDRHRLPGQRLGGAAQDPDGQGAQLFLDRQRDRRAGGKPRCRRRGRRQPDVVRGALPPGARQIRRADRLPLGPHPQAGDPRLGGRPGREG